MKTDAIAQAMTAIVGDSNVWPWDTLADPWKTRIQQAIAPDQPVAGLVFPATTAELADVVTQAHTHQCPILPCGHASKLSWGGLIDSAASRTEAGDRPSAADAPLIVVSTSRLNRLIDHAVGDLTVTVEAGMRFAELQTLLAKAGQFLAIDPVFPAEATLGGIVATGDTGSLRQCYNSLRDMLLGISFVRADGQIVKAGGRVVKNVAGYDLMKLLTGSYGTLGILTQLTFRLYPLPERSQTLVVTGDAAAIAQLSRTILRSALTPTSFDLLSPSLVQQFDLGRGVGLAVRFQAIAASVQTQMDIVTTLAQQASLTHRRLTDAADIALWQRLTEQMAGDPRAGAIACKIGIQPSQAMVFFGIHQLTVPDCYAQIHLASGLGRLLIQPDTLAPEDVTSMRAVCQNHQGFLTVLTAPIALKQAIDVWGYTGNALRVMQQIKHQFDPTHGLSPRRFVGGI